MRRSHTIKEEVRKRIYASPSAEEVEERQGAKREKERIWNKTMRNATEERKRNEQQEKRRKEEFHQAARASHGSQTAL